MHKLRVVGDIHGQIDVMKMALDCNADRVVFCGDLIDSYRQPIENQIACLELALELGGTERVDIVWANHEWSYLHPQMQCSGYTARIAEFIEPLKEEIKQQFKPFVYEGGYLITHAGLTSYLWNQHALSLSNFEQTLLKWSKDMSSPFFHIGRYRGGRHPVGGPLWCDFNMEFQPIQELPQIFGHTRGKGFRVNGNATCIDTLENTEPQFLDIAYA